MVIVAMVVAVMILTVIVVVIHVQANPCYEGNTYKREVNVKCPPCPPCARCPEPAFDCKKVPAYRESDDRYLPRPILNDFSTFGM